MRAGYAALRYCALQVLQLACGLLLFPSLVAAEAPAGEGWSSIEVESLIIYYRDDDAGLAQAIADIGPSTVDYVSVATGTPIPERVDVILVRDAASFASLQPAAPPSWAVGTAWSARGEIYLRTGLPHIGPDPIQKTFVHELCHIMVGRLFAQGRPPRWLQEGVAMLFAGEMRPSDQAALVRAAVGGSLLPLQDIARTWPKNAGLAHLAYLQSVDFVAYLFRLEEGALASLIERLAAGQELDAAVRAATSRSLAELEADWRRRLSIWHALVPLLGGPSAFWGLAVGVFLLATWKRRRQKQAQMAAFEQRELAALQRPEQGDSMD